MIIVCARVDVNGLNGSQFFSSTRVRTQACRLGGDTSMHCVVLPDPIQLFLIHLFLFFDLRFDTPLFP